MVMKKILLLLLGLTIAVGASAGVDSWNQQHDAIKQKQHQALDQRFMSHNMQHKSTTPTKRRGEGPEVITEQPAGQLVTYQRSGNCANTYESANSQSGHVMVVYDPDGTTVYVKGLACRVYESAWVTGTIANGKITIPLGQYVFAYYGEEGDYYYGLYLAWGSIEKDQSTGKFVFTADPNVTEVTYTIDGDNIIMDNSNGGDEGEGATGLASYWDDEDTFYNLEWGTVFTPHEIDIPSEIITKQPEGELVTYGREASRLSSYDSPYFVIGEDVNVVYDADGETVYFQNIASGQEYYDAWVRGTISGGKIHVPLGQFTYFDLVDGGMCLAWGSTATAPENEYGFLFTFTPDPTATEVTFTIDGDNLIMDNSTVGNNGDGATGLAMLDVTSSFFFMDYNTHLSPFVEPTVIEDQPEGELVTYQRGGYYYSGTNIRAQSGEVNIVYAPDGETVYIEDIMCNSDIGTWVMGTIENGKIHVPMKQFITWQGPKKQNNRGSNGWGIMLAFGQTYFDEDENQYMFNYDPTITEATFTINGNVISLDGTSFGPNDDMDGATGLVAVYSDEPAYFAQIDINTVFTLPPAVIDEQPEGELVTYQRSGYRFSWNGEVSQQDGTANIVYAPDGETVYIQNIIYNGPGTWVRGTISGGKIHVPTGQIIAILQPQDPVNVRGNRSETEYIVLNTGQAVPDSNYPDEYILNYDPSVTEITFSINGNNIILDNTSFGPNGDANGAMVIAASLLNAPQYFYQCDLLTVFGEPQAVPTVITNQPQGELVTYLRTGDGIWNPEQLNKKDEGNNRYINDWIGLSSQWSTAYVVYAPDGQTVYLQDPVYCNYQYNRGSWVRGSLNADGTKITVPLGQYVEWHENDNYGSMLVWGSISVEETDDPNVNQDIIFTPDSNVTEVTYTISNGCISLDNTEGPTVDEYYALCDQYSNNEIDWGTYQAALSEMLQGTGLAYVYTDGNAYGWTNEINWGTRYISKHPATLPEPVIKSWHEAQKEWEETYLEVQRPEFDTDGLPIFDEALSYSIYIDNDQLYTFDASNYYGIEENMTEVTYDMWQNHDWDLYIGHPTFSGTWSDTDGFVPFFNWRIGIQFHYTVDGVKNSTGITYIEVYEKPNDVQPGDANGDNEITIADVSTLIDMLLDDAEYFEGADVNGDGIVTIADVSALIDMLLEN
jgi:hypothetical protein